MRVPSKKLTDRRQWPAVSLRLGGATFLVYLHLISEHLCVEICWLLAATLSLTRSSLEYPYPPPSRKPKTCGLRKSSTQPPCRGPLAVPNVPFRDQVEVCLAKGRGKGKKMSKRECAGCCSWFSSDRPRSHHHHGLAKIVCCEQPSR